MEMTAHEFQSQLEEERRMREEERRRREESEMREMRMREEVDEKGE
jgi:hypothetical protein